MEEEGLRKKGEPGGCRWEEERGSMGEVEGDGNWEEGRGTREEEDGGGTREEGGGSGN